MSAKDNIITTWLGWQFYESPKFLLKVWNNYINFAANYFSLGLLLRTFFAPWRRYNWQYPKNFDAWEFFNTFISNSVSRILGAMVRIVLIIVGILFQIVVAVAGLIIFLAWLLAPFIIISGILWSLI